MAVLDQLVTNLTEMKLLESRTLFISEGINAAVAKTVVSQLLALDIESDKPIHMYLNSPGGEVNSGFAIYDTMRFIKSEVKVITTGLCASIATIINCGAPKQHRYSTPNSKFLIHQPLIGGQVQGQASDIEITAREIIKTRAKINKLLSDECGQSLGKVEEDTTRDYWMSAEEAVEYGLASKIIENISDIA
ncbi:MAG: ATP-dependent Clp protease proteolytic subunit [Zetaproteobacteria bacterium]|nr:ATP-dependent Clp protease proteolytic subunit [Pseudobdellovibrionaceae bacterium]